MSCEAHLVEFVAPPRPQCPFDRVAVGSSLSDAVGVQDDRNSIELLGRGPLPALAAPLDEADRTQPVEDVGGLLDRPSQEL